MIVHFLIFFLIFFDVLVQILAHQPHCAIIEWYAEIIIDINRVELELSGYAELKGGQAIRRMWGF